MKPQEARFPITADDEGCELVICQPRESRSQIHSRLAAAELWTNHSDLLEKVGLK
jgi:hypothetical protein